jgi:MFS family permease
LTIYFLILLRGTAVWELYMAAVFFGLGYGGLAGVQSPMVAEYCGLKEHGVIFGLSMFICTIGGSLGPVLAGRIFDTTGSYHLHFVICAAVAFTSIVLAALLKPARVFPVAGRQQVKV